MSGRGTESASEPWPWRWFVLNLPFGATASYVGVTLGYAVSRAGLETAVASSLVAACILPHTLKVLWAPLTDATFTRKTWYVAANVINVVTLGLIGLLSLRDDLTAITALVFVNAVAASFLGMAAAGLMALTTSSARIGRAAGFFQAGNLGGACIGGGLGLVIAEHVGDAEASLVTAGMLALCTLALVGIPSPKEPRERGPVAAFRDVGRDVWSVFASRRGLVAILFCLLPLMAGSLSGLFSNLAGDWHASGDLVVLVTGVLGGVVSMVGAIAGGGLADRLGRKTAFLASGVLVAAVTLLVGLFERTPASYATLVLAYSAASGVCYGTFSAFVFDVIGKGAAATKYNVLASIANVPILYMTVVNGALRDSHDVSTMLTVDAVLRLGAVAVLALIGRQLLRRPLPSPHP